MTWFFLIELEGNCTFESKYWVSKCHYCIHLNVVVLLTHFWTVFQIKTGTKCDETVSHTVFFLVSTGLPSAGTRFTRCWRPERRRCRPLRGTRAAWLFWHCTWQSGGGPAVCSPCLARCRGHSGGLTSSRDSSRTDSRTAGRKIRKHAGVLNPPA